MIGQFFKQTNDTIWDFLSEIGRSREVYSHFSYYEIDGCVLFFYAMPTEIVLMCLDIVGDGAVGEDLRKRKLCPVMDLFEYASLMRKFLATSGQFNLVPAIHLVLLTNARPVNYMKGLNSRLRSQFGFSALHNLSGLEPGIIYHSYCAGHPLIPVNSDKTIDGSAYWMKWHTYLENQGWYDWNNPLYDDNPPPVK